MSQHPPPEPTSQRPTQVRWLMFVLAGLVSYINYVHRYSWGVAKSYMIEDGTLTTDESGWLDGLFSVTYGIGQFPGGLAGDLFGPRLVITIVAVLWCCVVAGPALTTSLGKLAGIRLGLGLTQAAAYPNLGKITQSWFPRSSRTSVQGFVSSFAGRAGGACSSLIITSLLVGYLGYSWQESLILIAAAGVVFAGLFFFLFRNSPREHPWSNDAEAELIEAGEVVASETAKPRIDWTPANRWNLGIFCGASFFSTFADNLFVFWMPTFLLLAAESGNVERGILASVPLFGGALGGLFGGFFNDYLIRRLGDRRLARQRIASGCKLIAAALIVSSLGFQDMWMIMGVLFFCKFFSDMSQPTWWGTVTDIGGPAAGRVFGMVNTVGAVGAAVAGPIMGYVLLAGWDVLFYFVAAIYVITAVFWSKVDCTRRLVVTDSA